MEIQTTTWLLADLYRESYIWLGTILAILGKCHECGKEVSSTAEVCPHCGCKKPYNDPTVGCLILIAVIVFLIILFSQNH